ncbi:substrate-binding domain-containing protein [Bifidobacterium simiarum]|uniref:substrate-binding domain-containing protein n=1 Tax=Bifidobacterium simiarum TaxID=2045441 RepID=UPI001BDD4D39|nr:substrate-binding domain-containing protein [Bifidobacterium simiarum]
MLKWRERCRMIFSAATCAAMLLTLAACGETDSDSAESPSASASATTGDPGTVSMFLPSDGITLSQSTPLNKWTKLERSVTEALVDQGIDKDDITTTSSKSLEDQADAINDRLAERSKRKNAEGNSGDSDAGTSNAGTSRETMIVAPVASPDDVTRQYGDYVSQSLSTDENNTAENNTDDKSSASASSSASSSSSSSSDTSDDTSANGDVSRLVTALNRARKAGVRVILVANSIEGYTPDVFVSLSTLRDIARTQATLLASKLELSQTSSENPKHVEILLSANADDAVTKEVFSGIWEVLGPYYRSGAAVSPSGLLDAHSDADSWKAVSFQATDAQAVRKELSNRLDLKNSKNLPAIDGVLAMNDFVASAVVSQLSSAGYRGSAADINPQITIGGIVDNIVGNKDLKKHRVPDPQKSSGTVSGGATDADGDTATDAWPIVTGYGAYLSNITNVVDGAQWSTGLEDRDAYAKEIAKTATLLNAGKGVSGDDVDGTTTMNGKKVPLIEKTPVSVSANNLKKTLIDPGYIRPADAGL